MQTIDFLPAYSTWDDWNGNLMHYFGDQLFPVVSELNWKEVAQAVAANAVFQKYAVQGPEEFPTWQAWANSLVLSINGDRA
jgi:hypothetical protein